MNKTRFTFAVGALAASTVAVALLFVLLAGSSNMALASEPAAPVEVPEQADVLAPNAVVTITILHTNDFHGNLEADYKGRGGSAYMAGVIDGVRTTKGADNVALLDAGDVFLGAPPSVTNIN